jgi:23S rRNA (pseudouridine1915-N3)-methyltransferase
MYQIRILSINKTKEGWLHDALQDFIKRMQPVVRFELLWAKNEAQLLTLAAKESLLIGLDASGEMMDSEQFSGFLLKKLEEGGARLAFVIGGAEGLPSELKKSCFLISLSRMTFTHQLARLILIEQLYRAFEIAKGSRYHK